MNVSISKSGLCCLCMYVLAAYSAGATERFVAREGQTPAAPYNSWYTAASNIQDAVNAASVNDTLWIGPGRYTLPPNAVHDEGANVVHITQPLTLRGASGNPESVVIDGEAAHRGIMIRHAASTTNQFVIEGITVSNCAAVNFGGGIYIVPGTWGFVLRDSIITDNTVGWDADSAGGGVHADAIAGFCYLIENSIIRNNRAMSNPGVGPYGVGGGLYLRMQAPGEGLIVGSLIDNNSAARAGGMYLRNGTIHVLDRCIVRNNVAEYNVNAGYGGGGIYLDGNYLSITNTLMYNNLAAGNSRGGAIACQKRGSQGVVRLDNCTIVDNQAGDGKGIFIRAWGPAQDYNPTLQLYNTIVYSEYLNNISATPAPGMTNYAYNSCYPATENAFAAETDVIHDAPLFVDTASANYRLDRGSPCVDTGLYLPWMDNAVDLDGHARIDKSGLVDIGCYEYRRTGLMIRIR